ncbi:hypothetical protein GW17_00059961 [Ensete ventricosum]|nr:hypothetical protein GW17_00059961 [Ensete ventricosum]
MYSFQNQDLELQFLLSFCHVLHQIVVSFVAIKLDRLGLLQKMEFLFLFFALKQSCTQSPHLI